jgi:hypothetical protein
MPTVIETTWRPFGVTDLLLQGITDGRCENCGTALRFLHELTNDYGDRLFVGVDCARNLCHGYDGTDEENKLKNRWHRRENWSKRKWCRSRKGHEYLALEHEGRRIVVTIFAGKSWGFTYCLNLGFGSPVYGRQYWATENEAKVGAYDALSKTLDW